MGGEGVGDRLRRFRRLRRLSQEQLSELAGVRRDYIANLERGATLIPREPDQLKLLAKALRIRLRDLAEPTGWYEEEESQGSWEAGLLADSRLDDSAKDALLRILRPLLAESDEQDEQAG